MFDKRNSSMENAEAPNMLTSSLDFANGPGEYLMKTQAESLNHRLLTPREMEGGILEDIDIDILDALPRELDDIIYNNLQELEHIMANQLGQMKS
jgi:hypothetical protein